jgi:hypothetical protein
VGTDADSSGVEADFFSSPRLRHRFRYRRRYLEITSPIPEVAAWLSLGNAAIAKIDRNLAAAAKDRAPLTPGATRRRTDGAPPP